MAEGRILSRRSVSMHLQFTVIKRDSSTCQYCGKVGVFMMRFGKPAVLENPKNINLSGMDFYNGSDVIKFEIDHIIPVIQGGMNIVDNLILSCRKCNRSKGWR